MIGRCLPFFLLVLVLSGCGEESAEKLAAAGSGPQSPSQASPGQEKEYMWTVYGPMEMGNTPPDEKDPKSAGLDREVGHFTINGVTFHVPRKYIPFRRYEQSGTVSDLNLDFYLPDMAAESEVGSLSKEERRVRNTHGILADPTDHRKCFAGQCKGVLQVAYQVGLHARHDGPPVCPENGVHRPELGLTSYVIQFGPMKDTEWEFLVKGDPCEPEDYLICDTKDRVAYPHCKRFFLFQDKVIVKYTFDRKELANHEAIARLWLSKLDEFTRQSRMTQETTP